jgi:hypothetical protein
MSSPADLDGAAVLDIGGDVGALVLYAPSALVGREVEVEPQDRPAARVHTVVRERRMDDRRLFPAVFPALPAGRYRICAHGVAALVTIVGGTVTEAEWPAVI